MGQTTMLYNPYDIYDRDIINPGDVQNKLLCTFIPYNAIDDFINEITSQYTVLYDKIFVLHVKSNDEYVCTYNVDQPNINELPQNTILVHRKKESNTLYTINVGKKRLWKRNAFALDISLVLNTKRCVVHSVGRKKVALPNAT